MAIFIVNKKQTGNWKIARLQFSNHLPNTLRKWYHINLLFVNEAGCFPFVYSHSKKK